VAGKCEKEVSNEMEKIFCVICFNEIKSGIACHKCIKYVPAMLEELRTQVDNLDKALANKELAEDEDTAESYNATALKFFQKGDYKRALDYYKKVLSICERLLDKDHPNIAKAYRNISSVYEKQAETEKQPADTKTAEKLKCPVYFDKEKLYKELSSKIIGQKRALRTLVSVMKIHLAKVNPKRPANLLAFGPTGVGKSESFNAIFEICKDNMNVEFGLIKIDCNMYMESHRISNFLGAPQGYRDSGETNLFSPLLDKRCLILLDEVEKAHPNVLTALMGILDHGILTLSSPLREKDKDGNPIKGNEGKDGIQEIDFRFSVIMMTSNLNLDSSSKRLGFSDDIPNSIIEEDRCREALTKITLPEIAGRIMYFLQYESLSEEASKQIIRLEVEKCANTFDLSVEVINDTIVDEILQATGKKFGSRSHRSLIEQKIAEPLINYLESEPETKSIELTGNLNSIKITPICNDDIWDEKHEYPF
jgi:ATP-dependent Clp protease ATP-binding subunit ClpA